MIRHIAIAVIALISSLIGDFHYVRLWSCVLGSAGIVALVYLFALPTELPVWPGFIFVGLAGLLGLFREKHANQRMNVSSNLLMNRDAKKRPLS